MYQIPATKKNVILTAIILILLAGNIFFGVNYFLLQSSWQEIVAEQRGWQFDKKVLAFAELFIDKVLKAEKEVSFDERLKLENAVRDLNDKEILTQWEKFTNSKTEAEAQEEVKNLLELLVKKISY